MNLSPQYLFAIFLTGGEHYLREQQMTEKMFTILQIHECCQDRRGHTHYCSGSEARTDAGIRHCRPHQQDHREVHCTRKTHQTPWQQLNCLKSVPVSKLNYHVNVLSEQRSWVNVNLTPPAHSLHKLFFWVVIQLGESHNSIILLTVLYGQSLLY